MEKQEKFAQIIAENIAAGFQRGVSVFTEGLEEDLNKQAIIENAQLEGVIDFLMEEFENN